MYNNETAGPAFEEFLDLLGQRVRLKGFSKYRAQLDNKSKLRVVGVPVSGGRRGPWARAIVPSNGPTASIVPSSPARHPVPKGKTLPRSSCQALGRVLSCLVSRCHLRGWSGNPKADAPPLQGP